MVVLSLFYTRAEVFWQLLVVLFMTIFNPTGLDDTLKKKKSCMQIC